jgi:hypothetical protein
MNRPTTFTLLGIAAMALAAIAAAASGGATAPEASTKPDLGKSLARLVRAAARPREYERRVVAFFDSALVKGGAK